MKQDLLATYLNDHLAGSTAALELVKHAITQNDSNEYALFLQGFLREMIEDRNILKKVIESVGATQSSLKKISAWVLEKISRLKINNTIFHYSNVSRFLELEGLLVGVSGKENLWKVLDTYFSHDLRLSEFNFNRLYQRSVQQREEIQEHALKAAKLAFAG